MGTTAFVGYKYNEKVQGFSMSGNGYYEAASDEMKSYIEDLCENMYEIWEIDWKKEFIEIEDGKGMVEEGCYSREYGYIFNLDNDTVEVYNQGDYDWDKREYVDGPHKLKLIITRENIEKVKYLFENSNEIYKKYDEAENYEELYMKEA